MYGRRLGRVTLALGLLAPVAIVAAPEAQAVPTLQLSIDPSAYDNGTETVVASANPFTVYAWATPSGNTSG